MIRSWLILILSLCTAFAAQAQTITIGTGTAVNSTTGYPAPYGNWNFGARHQFLIRASEINAAGISGPQYINSLAFNVSTAAGTQLNGFGIKLANSSVNAFSSSTGFQSNTTQVYGPASYNDVLGWNTHTFHTPFRWDGTSNLIVEVCFNNTAYTFNAKVAYTTTSFTSASYRTADESNICTKASTSTSTRRPNIRLNFISPDPPVAAFTLGDSLWTNTLNIARNQSTHYTKCYWDISGVAANRFCNTFGCFIDSSTDLNYTFTQPGTYQVKLVVVGFFGTDSVKKTIHVINTYRKPQANFYLSAYNVGTPTPVTFFDSSLYGVYGWEWSISPLCNGCSANPYQFPNMFTPSPNVQNPVMYTLDGGVFDVCLKVWNDIGSDQLCKRSILNITQGFFMCNGGDSISDRSTGYLYDLGGPTENYNIGTIGQCKAGFVINPAVCADTIALYVEQFRLRTNDTLEVRDGGLITSPVIRKLTGANLPAASKTIYARSGKMFVRMTTGSGSSSQGDSGFVLRWDITRAAKFRNTANSFCESDSMLLTVSKKAGRTYTWQFNGAPLSNFTDTFCMVKTEGTYGLTVQGQGCVDTTLLLLSADAKVKTAFTIDKDLQCVNDNAFHFADRSKSTGTYSRSWNLGIATNGISDSATSQTYTNAGVYTISLMTTTARGCKDTLTKYIRVAEAPVARVLAPALTSVCAYDSIFLRSASILPHHYQWLRDQQPLPGDTLTTGWARSSGSYVLQVTNELGCTSLSDPLNLVFRKQPEKPVISRDGVRMVSSAASGNQWYVNDTMITGATQPFLVPAHNGSYKVRVDSNDCFSLSAPFVASFTGIAGATHQGLFEVYPNPAQQELNVHSTVAFMWVITDLSGCVLLKSDDAAFATRIDVSMLGAGLYLLQTSSRQGTTTTRFEKR